MAESKRPLLILLLGVVVMILLVVAMPRPGSVAVRDTPLAPTTQIEKAEDASAVSDAADERLRQSLEQAGS
ncbi:MAG: hypothetical protein ACR2LK_10320 [Solirubrobacteraceae bacterium]